MSAHHDYGPLISYEITWKSGHVEVVQAHQVIHTGGHDFFIGNSRPERIKFHGEFDGRWRLVLDVPADDIHIIRDRSTERLEVDPS